LKKRFLIIFLISFICLVCVFVLGLVKLSVPKISVVIPCYNVEEFFPNVREMLVQQSFKDFEVIFVDDASTDNSNKMIKDFVSEDNRARLVTLNVNSGAGNARNVGLKKARGHYLIFLDADDVYHSDLLKKCYETAVDKGVDILFFKTNYYDFKRNKLYKEDIDWLWSGVSYPKDVIFKPEDVGEDLFNFCRGAVWNKFYKRKFIVDNNIQFSLQKRHNDSVFVYSSYVMAKSMYVIDDVLYTYRVNIDTSITNKYVEDELYKLRCNYELKRFLEEHNLLSKYQKALDKYEKAKF